MQKSFIIGLIIAIILVLFAVQNAAPVEISLLFWHPEASMAVLILVSIALGALVGYLLSFSTIRNKNRSVKLKDQQIKNLNKALEEAKSKIPQQKKEEQ